MANVNDELEDDLDREGEDADYPGGDNSSTGTALVPVVASAPAIVHVPDPDAPAHAVALTTTIDAIPADPQATTRYSSVLVCDDGDVSFFKEIVESSPTVQEQIAEGLDYLRTFRELTQDLLLAVYKGTDAGSLPAIRKPHEILPAYAINFNLVRHLMTTEEYKNLRSICVGDPIGAFLGVEMLQREAINWLKQVIEQLHQRRMERKQLRDNPIDVPQVAPGIGGGQVNPEDFVAMSNLLHAQDEAVKENFQRLNRQKEVYVSRNVPVPDSFYREQARSLMTAAKAEEFAKQCEQYMGQELPKREVEIRLNMNSAAEKAVEEIGEVTELMQEWGLDAGNPNVRITWESRIQAVERLRRHDKFKQFADAVGAALRVATRAVYRRSQLEGMKVKDVKLGNNIHNATAGEKMKLNHPTLKRQVYKAIAENQLLETQKEGQLQPLGKGRVIFLRDDSGSMGGKRNEWATALSLGTVRVAQETKRDACVIRFDGITQGVHMFYKNRLDPNEFLDIAEFFTGGGTNFIDPITRAIEILESDPHLKGADIILATDGHMAIAKNAKEAEDLNNRYGKNNWGAVGQEDYDTWLEWYWGKQRKLGFRLIGVLINVNGDVSNHTIGRLIFDPKKTYTPEERQRILGTQCIPLSNLSDLSEKSTALIFDKILNMPAAATASDEDLEDDSVIH